MATWILFLITLLGPADGGPAIEVSAGGRFESPDACMAAAELAPLGVVAICEPGREA